MQDEGEMIANVEFDFQFAGKVYRLKRANLRQVIEFQRKILAIDKADSTISALALVPALLISLSTIDPSVTEDYILNNTPGDIDILGTLQLLGFMNQKKVVAAQKIADSLVEKAQSSGDSSLLR